MNIAVTSYAPVIVLVAIAMVLFIAVLRMPRWFAQSLAHHALWRMRDDLVDDMLSGRLPKDHAAVRELLGTAEWVIAQSPSATLVRFYVWRRICNRSETDVRDQIAKRAPSWHGLSDAESERLGQYRNRLGQLAATCMLFGSWLGLWHVIRRIGPGIREARRVASVTRGSHSQKLEAEFAASIRVAADRASAESWVGQYSRELVPQATEPRLTGVA
jgi:hypothetical protein